MGKARAKVLGRSTGRLGFTPEHLRTALQFAVAVALVCVLVCMRTPREWLRIWVFVFFGIVLTIEPLVGQALMSSIPAIAGMIMGMALGSGMAALWETVCHDSVGELGFGECSVAMTTVLAVLGGFLLMLHLMRFPEHTRAIRPGIILFFVGLYFPELIQFRGMLYYGAGGAEAHLYILKAKVLLCMIIGAILTLLTSLLAFPLTANRRILRLSESALEGLGGITHDLLGIFLQDAGPEGRLPGSSGTDEKLRFVDDGLEQRLRPLARRIKQVEGEVYMATSLLPAARTERRVFKWLYRRRALALHTLDTILTCAKNVATMQAASLSACTDGRVRLGLCQRNRCLMECVRHDLMVVFVALSKTIERPNQSTERHAAHAFRDLADALVELYHGASVLASGGYDADLEAFALFTKTCTVCARQMALIYKELCRDEGKEALAYFGAAFKLTAELDAIRDMGSCPPPARPPRGGQALASPQLGERNQRLTALMLQKFKSFHASDNPFEGRAGSLDGSSPLETQSQASPQRSLAGR